MMVKGGTMKIWIALACAAGIADGASAQDITLKPLLDARLRSETVDQDDLPDRSQAVTMRIRSGVQASDGPFSALIESEATLGIDNGYNDGLNGRTRDPLIADPQNVELNRAQLRYAVPAGSITVGRQLLELADQRFVGSASFRQNQQTFDAVRVQWKGIKHLTADVTYAWSDRTINGIDGTGARQQAVSGNNFFGLLGYETPVGTLTGFTYIVDQDEAAVQGFRLSSQTYGGRFAGSQPLGAGLKLAYTGSFARQSDYHHNPNDYSADYYLGEVALSRKALSATAGYEVLGADRHGPGGVALTSFQTPLASLFKFQGWDDKFTTTPVDGIRDAYGTLGSDWKRQGLISDVALTATYHRFDSDRGDTHYGNEVDLLASAKIDRYTVSARYAHYDADRFAADTDKLWLTAEFSL
jgi:hypothetical protein